MIQNKNNVTPLIPDSKVEGNFNGGAIVASDGREIEITESAVQQSLRELESVWMKHHNHYAEVLDKLMLKVEAARGIV